MSNCIFCKIINNEVPSYTVYEDDKTRAFLDIFPSAPGHVMVILKKHGDTVLDYASRELSDLMTTTQKVVGALERVYDTKTLTIGINHGEPSGVPHLHIHIIPRTPADAGGVIQSIVKREGKDTIQKECEKIKIEIKN